MLNTSLHNPSVKDKPSPEQFVAMNRGINNGGDLPQELLLVSGRMILSLMPLVILSVLGDTYLLLT